jgi:hypothetical protein
MSINNESLSVSMIMLVVISCPLSCEHISVNSSKRTLLFGREEFGVDGPNGIGTLGLIHKQ